MSSFWKDVTFGAKTLLRNPAFSLAAVAALVLGIGANTAIFTVVNSVLLRGLAYSEPDRLVRIFGMKEGKRSNVNPLNLLDWRDRNAVFSEVAAYSQSEVTIVSRGQPERLRSARVSQGFFPVLSTQPALGRIFSPQEDRPGGPRVAIISHRYRLGRFGPGESPLGETLTVNGIEHEIVGVLPAEFRFFASPEDRQPQVWLPLRVGPRNGRGGHWLQAIARLRDGVDLERAVGDMDAIAARLQERYPETNTGWGVELVPLQESLVGDSRSALLLLLAAVGMVLLIACANVANLLLTRAAVRRREIAIRRTLGAGGARLLRQLITEASLIALAGGTGGLLLGWVLIGWLAKAAALGNLLPQFNPISVDVGVLAFTLAVTLLSLLVFGTFPALWALRGDVQGGLASGGFRGGTGAGRQRLRSAFLVAEVALTLVLLVGAGLLIRSFERLSGVDPGLDPENVLTIEVVLPNSYQKEAQIGAFYRNLLDTLRDLPGVLSAGAVNNLPFWGDSCDGFKLDDRPQPPPGERPCAYNQLSTPGYFSAMGIPLLAGRDFSSGDRSDSRPVVMVNETLARRFWPDRSAVGRRLSYNGISREIVGVVQAVRRRGLGVETEPEMFIPHLQDAWDGWMILTVRHNADAGDVIASIRRAIRDSDASVPVGEVSTMERFVGNSIASERFRTLTLAIFALVAIGLSSVGVYGVVAFNVSRRTNEIGLRIALGATRSRVLGMAVGGVMRLTGFGIALGLIGSIFMSRALSGLLFGIEPGDPLTLAAVSLFLASVAALAGYLPARRATRVDPSVALRYE